MPVRRDEAEPSRQGQEHPRLPRHQERLHPLQVAHHLHRLHHLPGLEVLLLHLHLHLQGQAVVRDVPIFHRE